VQGVDRRSFAKKGHVLRRRFISTSKVVADIDVLRKESLSLIKENPNFSFYKMRYGFSRFLTGYSVADVRLWCNIVRLF